MRKRKGKYNPCYNKNKRKGKDNPAYIHGLRCNENTKENRKLRKSIYKRDNYKCQNCNITQEECLMKYNRKLDIHHIDGNHNNNILENMITFCRSCHRKQERILANG